jgi:hypothetical protein
VTIALTMLAGALLGAATATSVLVPRLNRRLQEAGWRGDHEPTTGEIPLDPVELRVVRARALRFEAVARRQARTIAAMHDLHRYVIGDLLDAIADRDDALHAALTRPRHMRRSPVPAYGIHRTAAA